MENKNVIVTGGLGFIGSHIVEELIKNNRECQGHERRKDRYR